MVATATGLTAKLVVDPLDFAINGYHRFRRYTPRLLETLHIQGTPAAASLLEAIAILKWLNRTGKQPEDMELPTQFARPKWKKVFGYGNKPDRRTWEVALLFTIRDSFQSKDIWLAESRQHRDFSS